jgi:hypothetical protein
VKKLLWSRSSIYGTQFLKDQLITTMTPQRAQELLPIIKAFAEGKAVEQRSEINRDEWIPANGYHIDSRLCYRIKPEPKTRPWSKPEDVPGPVCWISGDGIIGLLIVSFHSDGGGLAAGRNEYTWEDIEARKLKYSTDRKTWSPCTVTEE